MKKILYIFIALSSLVVLNSCANANVESSLVTDDETSNEDGSYNDESIDLGDREFPMYYAFRTESTSVTDYDVWLNRIGEDLSGVIRKFLTEELQTDASKIDWLNQYAEDNPDEILLLHYNGQARRTDDESADRFFPGHWAYYPGCSITSAIDYDDTTIKVENAKLFTVSYTYSSTSSTFGLKVVVVPIVNGEKDWNNAEYCRVDSYNTTTNELQVTRAQNRSTARDHATGTYIAPIPGSVWEDSEDSVMWYYNMSSACPRDDDGNNCADVLADELISYFEPGGLLEVMHGIAFDVIYFDISNLTWDTNNSGASDHGWIDGVNEWAVGVYDFLATLRSEANSRVGTDFIITSDGQLSTNQTALGYVNGIESEGLVQHNDAWRGFSRTVNCHKYWYQNNTIEDFRYVVMKFQDDDDSSDENLFRLSRFAVGTASCLGAALAYGYYTYATSSDDYDYDNRTWMPTGWTATGCFGKLKSDLVHLAKSMATTVQSIDLTAAVGSTGSNVTVDGMSIIVSSNDEESGITLTIPVSAGLPTGDVTYFVNAEAVEPLAGFTTADYLVPRLMWLEPNNLPTNDSDFTDIYGYYGLGFNCENSYFFRDTTQGGNSITLYIQGSGEFKITSIDVYNAPDILQREFDNCTILVNPSSSTQTVNLSIWNVQQIDGVDIKIYK